MVEALLKKVIKEYKDYMFLKGVNLPEHITFKKYELGHKRDREVYEDVTNQSADTTDSRAPLHCNQNANNQMPKNRDMFHSQNKHN